MFENLPSTGTASLRVTGVPPPVWWQSTQTLEEAPCARAGPAEVDIESPASTARPDFRLAGLVFEETSHSCAMKVALCVAENLSLLSESGLCR